MEVPLFMIDPQLMLLDEPIFSGQEKEIGLSL